MVQTRSGKRTRRIEDQHDALNSFITQVQEQLNSQHSFDYMEELPNMEEIAALEQDLNSMGAVRNMYRSRHRPRDNEPYTENVVAYKRRKPLR